MGGAFARQLGVIHDLVLADASPSLNDFVRELKLEGFSVHATVVGDFRSEDVIGALGRHASEGFAALAHTAGLPPSAQWRDIIDVNAVATSKLLATLTPFVGPGTAAVLIASAAGHLAPTMPDVDNLLAKLNFPGMFDDIEPLLRRELGPAADQAIGTLAYAVSKKKVINLCEEYARDWGARGGRICSVSPGMIYTPMGRHEASLDQAVEAQVKSAPVGRWYGGRDRGGGQLPAQPCSQIYYRDRSAYRRRRSGSSQRLRRRAMDRYAQTANVLIYGPRISRNVS